ncbi:hypothetical protein [Trinickia violacea]|uniref:hypothetical protein n=1 Tax=Trinickia violacea TaxID=2571746 RepID=UPI0015865E6B|nr:hypothetical protein [Trinickia violacea]
MNQPFVPLTTNPAQPAATPQQASTASQAASMFRGARTVAFSHLVDRALSA